MDHWAHARNGSGDQGCREAADATDPPWNSQLAVAPLKIDPNAPKGKDRNLPIIHFEGASFCFREWITIYIYMHYTHHSHTHTYTVENSYLYGYCLSFDCSDYTSCCRCGSCSCCWWWWQPIARWPSNYSWTNDNPVTASITALIRKSPNRCRIWLQIQDSPKGPYAIRIPNVTNKGVGYLIILDGTMWWKVSR